MMNGRMRPLLFAAVRILTVWAVLWSIDAIAQELDAPSHEGRSDMLVIRNATVVDGTGAPAEGGMTIVIEKNRITHVYPQSAIGRPGFRVPPLQGDVREIDATGKYVLPGFINMHAHIHGPWGLGVFPAEYIYKLWLAAGITTIRDVGSIGSVTLQEREKSERGEIVAPRIFAYLWFPTGVIGSLLTDSDSLSEASLRREVNALHKQGADGLKLRGLDRAATAIVMDEARRVGLRVAHHVGLEDLDAWDNAELGTTSIEHWYGIPDAALDGVQSFPGGFDHNNELDRFRYAGRLWREANPERLAEVLQNLVDEDVAWDPTFAIYEASRDLQRALTQPAFRDYLHPAMARYFAPDPGNHGSYFLGWTNSDEVYWKENYRIWMEAVKEFEERGGIVTTGEDAGFIYQLFGFCFLRELQLHEEAGFRPLDVIRHATRNGAAVLGESETLGRIRPGYLADLVIVNGNPLENLQVLMPRGLDDALDMQGDGGIEWTIKDGYTYHAPELLADVRAIVDDARSRETQSGK
jgi:Amidohydrolase family